MPACRTAALLALTLATWTTSLFAQSTPPSSPLAWPAPTPENRLWTRWWWLGNAVDEKNLTRQLEQFHAAGLGGVEICPIYGALGAENRYLDFLSPRWMAMLAHTTRESQRLGMGVVMTTGTGWPFGGSTVPNADAAKGVTLRMYNHYPAANELPAGQLSCLLVIAKNGATQDVTGKKVEAVEGDRFLAVIQTGPTQKVKRAAPNAEGNVLDPYSVEALNHYLATFDKAFTGFEKDLPRGQFHDSFEYNASWTPNLFDEFQKRRGYDLRTQLPALNNEGPADTIARVKCDYRQTLSDLHLAYMNRWVEWSHTHGQIARNQAHGGPGNILDVYANADIPECEIFHLYDESQLPFLKLASSAAHVTGKKLTSSESFTWLDEHFSASLAQVKTAADFLFLTGVNHMFLHGIPYSPEDAAWPGWQFYASVNFGPTGGLWRDFPAFTAYVARVQSILQANKPSNDVLLYVPWHEFWSDPQNNNKLMVQYTTPGDWMKPYGFYQAAASLTRSGRSYDEVSDMLLQKAEVTATGSVKIGDGEYRAIFLPRTPYMPLQTLEKILDLARNGATIAMQDYLPQDVPGYGDLKKQQAAMKTLKQSVPQPPTRMSSDFPEESVVPYGKGRLIYGSINSGTRALRLTDSLREPMVDDGLRYIRRVRPDGYDYFVVNSSPKTVDSVRLATRFRSAVILDPRFDNRAGTATITRTPGTATVTGTPLLLNGPASTTTQTAADGVDTVALHLAPGESNIIRTFTDKVVEGPAWKDHTADDNPLPLTGTWSVAFIDGGPSLPQPFTVAADAAGKIPSWTTACPDAQAQRFAGTAKYTLEFASPPPTRGSPSGGYRLDLGKIGDSARITLNGKSLGTLWAAPFTLDLGDTLKGGPNILEIEVTNVAANRIADMDRRGVQWKIFRDANVLTTAYTPFDASKWPLRDAGILGPVTLTPLTLFKP